MIMPMSKKGYLIMVFNKSLVTTVFKYDSGKTMNERT